LRHRYIGNNIADRLYVHFPVRYEG
jgi:hypothetical protein